MSGRRRAFGGKELPNAADPSWEQHSADLLSFLDKPRDWTELLAWGKAQRFLDMELRNCLAWLSFRGLAEAVPLVRRGKKEWVWMRKDPETPK